MGGLCRGGASGRAELYVSFLMDWAEESHGCNMNGHKEAAAIEVDGHKHARPCWVSDGGANKQESASHFDFRLGPCGTRPLASPTASLPSIDTRSALSHQPQPQPQSIWVVTPGAVGRGRQAEAPVEPLSGLVPAPHPISQNTRVPRPPPPPSSAIGKRASKPGPPINAANPHRASDANQLTRT